MSFWASQTSQCQFDYGASGALYGPARSLLAFDRALLEGELLTDDARATLWTGMPEFGFVALGQWSFSAPLEGCDGAVRIIERRGDVGSIQARNILLPDQDLSVIVFTTNARFDFGAIWTGSGFSHDLLRAAACPS
ncbi:MAG: hypothetical protein AAFY10_10225 [Pseudomonadota bacterium]